MPICAFSATALAPRRNVPLQKSRAAAGGHQANSDLRLAEAERRNVAGHDFPPLERAVAQTGPPLRGWSPQRQERVYAGHRTRPWPIDERSSRPTCRAGMPSDLLMAARHSAGGSQPGRDPRADGRGARAVFSV